MAIRSLYWKLSLAILLAAFTTAGLFAIFIRITSADRLMQFVIDQQRTKLTQVLAEYYQAQGNWQGIDQRCARLNSKPCRTSGSVHPVRARAANRSRLRLWKGVVCFRWRTGRAGCWFRGCLLCRRVRWWMRMC